MEPINTIGRRKNAISRIWMQPGKGSITVNDRKIEDYFPTEVLQTVVKQPFYTVEQNGNYDVKINVAGGGMSAQAQAARMAIAKALQQFDADLRPPLKKAGYLTRDSRMVERKKYGRRKARRSFQFSKR